MPRSECMVLQIADAVIATLREHFTANPPITLTPNPPVSSSIRLGIGADVEMLPMPAIALHITDDDGTEPQIAGTAESAVERSTMRIELWCFCRDGEDWESAYRNVWRLRSDVLYALSVNAQLGVGDDAVLLNGRLKHEGSKFNAEMSTLANAAVLVMTYNCDFDWQSIAP